MIDIREGDFSIEEVVAEAKRPDAGALVVFVGTVRDEGILGMEVEAYREVALPELEKIRDDATERFSLKSVGVVHKVGTLSVGDDIVVIACAAAHRQEAFQGCLHILEELKTRAPIWKKEIKAGGSRWA